MKVSEASYARKNFFTKKSIKIVKIQDSGPFFRQN